MESLLAIILIIVIYYLSTNTERKSHNHLPPKGYTTDWKRYCNDQVLLGVKESERRHAAGYYDIPDKK